MAEGVEARLELFGTIFAKPKEENIVQSCGFWSSWADPVVRKVIAYFPVLLAFLTHATYEEVEDVQGEGRHLSRMEER
jgi:hypothetical protein